MRFYYKYALKDVVFPVVKLIRVKKSKDLVSGWDIYHSDYVQIIDDTWLHLINGSNYANIKGKEEVIEEILTDIDLFYNDIRS